MLIYITYVTQFKKVNACCGVDKLNLFSRVLFLFLNGKLKVDDYQSLLLLLLNLHIFNSLLLLMSRREVITRDKEKLDLS